MCCPISTQNGLLLFTKTGSMLIITSRTCMWHICGNMPDIHNIVGDEVMGT